MGIGGRDHHRRIVHFFNAGRQACPISIQLLLRLGFQQHGAVFAVDNQALVFHHHGAHRIARHRHAAFAQMHARGFAAVNLNRVEFHFAAVQMVTRQLGNLHRHRHRQGQPHAHVIQHVFQRLVFVL